MFYLVANGLGATPLEKDLFDAAGSGHPETLRALQLGLRLHWFKTTAHSKKGETKINKTAVLMCCQR